MKAQDKRRPSLANIIYFKCSDTNVTVQLGPKRLNYVLFIYFKLCRYDMLLSKQVKCKINIQLTWVGISTNEQADRCVKVRSTATTNLHEG